MNTLNLTTNLSTELINANIEATANVDVLEDLCNCTLASVKAFIQAFKSNFRDTGVMVYMAKGDILIQDLYSHDDWRVQESPILRELYTDMRINFNDVRDQLVVTKEALTSLPDHAGRKIVKSAENIVSMRNYWVMKRVPNL